MKDKRLLKTWTEAAEFCSKEYGSYVDYGERYFLCPECADPIYECDWGTYHHFWDICPICEFDFIEGE